MELLLGIDVGTTACKAVLFDADANAVANARKEYKLQSFQNGRAEIDPNEMWKAVKFCICKIVEQCNGKIVALAVSSHGEGVIPLDAVGSPLGMEIVSFDTRSINEAKELEKKFGHRYFFEKGGQILNSAGSITKIMWMKKYLHLSEEPSAYVCAGDFITMKLSGERVIDYSLAARTMMLDIHKKQWNEELIEFIGLDKCQLSIPIQGGTLVGYIQKEVALETGLNEDALIVSGGHDQPCAILGTGITSTGEAAYSLGTTETLICTMERFGEKLYHYGLPCYPHVLEGQYITLPGNFTGGNLLQWYKNTFADKEQELSKELHKDVYEILMEEMSDRPSGLIVLPHFTTTGSPWNDSQSQGMIIGLQLSTTKGEYIRALQEGVTLEILLNITLLKEIGISLNKLVAVGGSTKSKKLMQLKADVLGIPLYVPEKMEASCKGAAFLAGYGLGIVDKKQKAWMMDCRKDKYFLPSFEIHRQYLQIFVKYRKMYAAGKKIFKN